MAKYRLDKFLAAIPIGSRSQVKDIIKAGRVSVNDTVATRPEIKIDTELDTVTVDKEKVFLSEKVYYMLNKPAGVITATTDRHRQTVMDLLSDKRRDLFPVGRLDIDTEGLLLITNDGELGHELLSPKHHVDKTYFVRTDLDIPEQAERHFAEGVDLGDFKSMPARLEEISKRECRLTIQEGKYHQVKRMFESEGVRVIYLKRLSMGALELDDSLALGESRALTQEELLCLKRIK